MVMPRTIRAADCKAMPWKNGQGTTTELVVEPEGAPLDGFAWRLSVAELRGSGPFSAFPGYDRILTQLDGRPMTLTHGAAEPVELNRLVPHAFSGDVATTCELEGIARDLNLIVRRDQGPFDLVIHRLDRNAVLRIPPGAASLVHVLEGELAGPAGLLLGAGDTRVESGTELNWRAVTAALAVAAVLGIRDD